LLNYDVFIVVTENIDEWKPLKRILGLKGWYGKYIGVEFTPGKVAGQQKSFKSKLSDFLTQHFSNHLGHTLTLSTTQEASAVKPLYLAQIRQCLNSLCLCFDDEPNAP
jgi:hypothetical protein